MIWNWDFFSAREGRCGAGRGDDSGARRRAGRWTPPPGGARSAPPKRYGTPIGAAKVAIQIMRFPVVPVGPVGAGIRRHRHAPAQAYAGAGIACFMRGHVNFAK